MLGRFYYFLSDFKFYLVFTSAIVFASGLVLYILHRTKVSSFKKNIFLGVVSLISSLSLAFFSGEAYFRYIYDQSDGLGFLKVNQKWHHRHVQLNGDFRRDKEFVVAKEPGEIRIGVIGDSIGFGYGIKNPQDRFSDKLETLLINNQVDATIYNLASSGWGTNEQTQDLLAKEYLNFDIVIWQYFLNDIETGDTNRGMTVVANNKTLFTPSGLTKKIIDHSYLADFLFWRLSPKHSQTFKQIAETYLSQYNDQELYQAHKADIIKFVKTLNRKQIKTIAIIFPIIGQPEKKSQAEHFSREIEAVFDQAGATSVINLAPILTIYPDNQLVVNRFDNHPNETIHSLAASLIYESILKIIKAN